MTELKPAQASIPRSIWVLGFVSMLMDISSEMVHSLLPLFMVGTLDSSVFAVGIIEGIAEATALIAKVFSGLLSDYFRNRKYLAVLGYAMSACTKPLFAISTSLDLLVTARFLDRIGKGVRGAPRDALIADITPIQIRGAAFGLRQALDTIGAFIGPLLATGLMLLWANDFRAIFWLSAIPALLAVALLLFGVKEPNTVAPGQPGKPISLINLEQLNRAYWKVAVIGAFFTLARFSEAFLVLRSEQLQIPIAYIPLVMVAMNGIYAASAYPFGKLSDRLSHYRLLALGLFVLIAADLVLANSSHWPQLLVGVALWGIHMGITQGLLAAMVANTAPADLRASAYGFFNFLSGLAMLIASGIAGFIWEQWGSAYTFYAGAGFSLLALIVMRWQGPHSVTLQ